MKLLAPVFVLLFAALAAPAAAEEKLLTLYSPPIKSEPYVHDTHSVSLATDGEQAPAEPGYWQTATPQEV